MMGRMHLLAPRLSTSSSMLALCCVQLLACAQDSSRPMAEATGIATLTLGSTTNESESGGSDVETDTLDGGDPCSLDDDCPDGEVCLPGSSECGPPGSCFVDQDCPDGQICE